MGFLIGFMAGLANAGTGFSAESASAPPCAPAVAETTTAAAEDTMDTEDRK